MAGFFAIVFIFGLLVFDIFATPTEFEAMKKMSEAEKATPQTDAIVRPTVEYTAADSKDPFQKPIVDATPPPGNEAPVTGLPERQLPSLTVQGVIWGGKLPLAIINDKVVKVGDIIEEAKIISIDRDGISVFFKDKQYNLASPASGVISH